MTDFNNVYAQQLRVGDTLPEFELPITARLVVSTALASQDFQDVHHDKDAAIAKESNTPKPAAPSHVRVKCDTPPSDLPPFAFTP